MKFLRLYLFAILLTGCASSGPIKMYSGPNLDESKIATIMPLNINVASLVLMVDGETPTSCWSSCMFYAPVQLPPGQHKFSSRIFNAPPGATPNPISPDAASQAHPLKYMPLKSSLFADAYEFEFEQSLQAGKKYQLMIGTTTNTPDWRAYMVVWWQEIN